MRNVLLFALAAALFLRADLNPSVNVAPVPPSTLAVTALSAAATTVTATLPLVTGQFHYITSISITRVCSALLAGTAVLAVTTTNLPGSLAWSGGNACVAGSTNQDLEMSFPNPIKSSVAGTATTFVAPSAGAAVQYRLTVTYYAAP
jgi:hypothetical protein